MANFDPLTLAISGLLIGAGLFTARQEPGGFKSAATRSLPHFLGLWVPLIGAILLLYVFVAIGLMEASAIDAAAAGDSTLGNPRWAVVILWLVGLWELLQFGRRLAGLHMADRVAPSFRQIKSLALLVAGLAVVYVAFSNPYSPLLMIPLLLWVFIGGRPGVGLWVDWLLFLAGGLMVYLLAYYSDYPLLRADPAALWALMTIFSVHKISFFTGVIVMAIVAAGLSMVTNPPIGRRRTEAKKASASAT